MNKLLILAGVALFAAACTSDRGAQRTDTTQVQTQRGEKESIEQEMQRIVSQADGSQPGRVEEMSDGMLRLDPYQEAAGVAQLRIDENTPVFQGGGKVTTRALQPGVDVRVFFDRSEAGERPRVIAVEVLEGQNARDIEQSIQNAPRSE